MAQQIINVGSAPNDGNGDTLRNSQIKVNANVTELYNAVDLKLDKVTTNDVEKVYIKNADGTQGMKPVSEFGGGGGEENVQSDWNQTNVLLDDYIKNKPELFSGDYNDLINTPALVTNHSELNLDDGTNPHGTTKNDVGLGNADNTSDLLKPISTATQTALNNLVTLNTAQTVTGSKQFNDVPLIKKTNTGIFPTGSGGSFYIGGTGDYNRFDFYSIDGYDSDGFGTSQMYSNPEEGNEIKHTSLDNQQGSILRIDYDDTHLRHIVGGQQTSLYVNGITDKITIEGTQNKFAALGTALITGTKNFEFPDKNGTLALSSDIIEYAENKLDKVTTNDVEKVYIKNADGTQSMKPTSDFGTVKGTGTINRISKFTAGGTIGDSQIFDNGTNVGIGTTSPQARLDVRAQGVLGTDIVLRVRNSTDTQNFLVVNGAGDVYNNGAKGVNTNTFFGENVGRNTTGSNNTAIGQNALLVNTTGAYNTAIGANALGSNTTGVYNAAIGVSALQNNTTGYSNMAIGLSALENNTTGNSNMAIGVSALRTNTTGNSNAAIGVGALYANTTGFNNAAIGQSAGRLISNGSENTITNNSIFIGFDTRALADNQTNQIVIGNSAIGLGSNSVVLGNNSITKTQLRGQVIMGAFESAPTGIEGAIYYDYTKKMHYGFDGTNWNKLY